MGTIVLSHSKILRMESNSMAVYEERFIFSCVYRRFNMEQEIRRAESKTAGRATETGITEAGASATMLPP